MAIKRIMVCLDGSKNSLKGLDTAVSIAEQTGSTLVCVYVITTFGAFTAVHTPKISEGGWPDEARGIIEKARKIVGQKPVKFEGIVIAGKSAGYDLTSFANNPANKIDHIVVGARGTGFPKELFFGSTSTFILHKAKAPVTVVK